MRIIKDLLRPYYHRINKLSCRRIGRLRWYKEYNLFKKKIHVAPVRLNIGSCGIYEKGWIPCEIDYLDLLNSADWEQYFRQSSIDAMLAEHVWEHLTEEEGLAAAKICFKYLKKGGYIRIAVPDGFNPDQDYIELIKPMGACSVGHEHKVLYNYISLSRIFIMSGFDVNLLEYYDENGKFQYNDWNLKDGCIRRSFKMKNLEKSLVIDAVKK